MCQPTDIIKYMGVKCGNLTVFSFDTMLNNTTTQLYTIQLHKYTHNYTQLHNNYTTYNYTITRHYRLIIVHALYALTYKNFTKTYAKL